MREVGCAKFGYMRIKQKKKEDDLCTVCSLLLFSEVREEKRAGRGGERGRGRGRGGKRGGGGGGEGKEDVGNAHIASTAEGSELRRAVIRIFVFSLSHMSPDIRTHTKTCGSVVTDAKTSNKTEQAR